METIPPVKAIFALFIVVCDAPNEVSSEIIALIWEVVSVTVGVGVVTKLNGASLLSTVPVRISETRI
jgi:hypothetical protein